MDRNKKKKRNLTNLATVTPSGPIHQQLIVLSISLSARLVAPKHVHHDMPVGLIGPLASYAFSSLFRRRQVQPVGQFVRSKFDKWHPPDGMHPGVRDLQLHHDLVIVSIFSFFGQICATYTLS